MITAALPNVNLSQIIGAHIIYRDPGVPFYAPPSQRNAVVVGVKESRLYGYYLLCKVDGINIEKHVTPEQVTQYVWAKE